jgi:hypothetical protein
MRFGREEYVPLNEEQALALDLPVGTMRRRAGLPPTAPAISNGSTGATPASLVDGSPDGPAAGPGAGRPTEPADGSGIPARH